MSALSKPYLFSVNTKEKPGKWVCYFVRFQTIEFDDNPILDKTKFYLFDPDDDKRAKEFASLIKNKY